MGETGWVRAAGRSETLFTVLALELLKPGGQLAVLLPSGPLFARGGYDQHLREQLANRFRLQAVISLPKDAFQPYNSVQTHLMLVRKPITDEPPATGGIWFYQVAHDGFTGGRNRQPEPERDQLPRLEAAVLSQDKASEFQFQAGEILCGLNTVQKNGSALAARFVWNDGGRLTLTRLARGSGRPAGLFASLKTPEAGTAGYLLARDGRGYGGLSQPVAMQLNFRQRTPAPGQCELSDEGLEEWSLLLTEDEARLEKKGKSIEFSLMPSEAGGQIFLVLLDAQGGLSCSPRWLSASEDALPKPLRPEPVAIAAFRSADGSTSGNLLVFERPSLNVVTLKPVDGTPVHFLDLNGTSLLFWPDDDGTIARIESLGSKVTYKDDGNHLGVVVDPEGVPFGLRVKRESIAAKSYNLQAATYFPPERVEREQRSPAQLLAGIKTKHRDLDRRIDYLLGVVELEPLALANLPSPVQSGIGPWARSIRHNSGPGSASALWWTYGLRTMRVRSSRLVPSASKTSLTVWPWRMCSGHSTYSNGWDWWSGCPSRERHTIVGLPNAISKARRRPLETAPSAYHQLSAPARSRSAV